MTSAQEQTVSVEEVSAANMQHLADLLWREGKHSRVWFSEQLLLASKVVAQVARDMASPAKPEGETELVEKLGERFARLLGADPVCCGRVASGTIDIMAKEAASRIRSLTAERDAALRECSDWARQAGEAKGKLEASEWPGIVDGWKERAERAEAEVERLREALGRIEQLTPYRANAASADDLHLTVKAIASSALSDTRERRG